MHCVDTQTFCMLIALTVSSLDFAILNKQTYQLTHSTSRLACSVHFHYMIEANRNKTIKNIDPQTFAMNKTFILLLVKIGIQSGQ